MLVLALDTSSKAGSVALVRDEVLVAVLRGDPSRTHGERLPGDLQRILEPQGLSPTDIDVYGVAAGPGSFTGLRVGIATIQALALVTARPVVPVSTLVALARAAAEPVSGSHGARIAAWIDGQRGDVFAALYERTDPTTTAGEGQEAEDPPAGLSLVAPASVDTPEAILHRWSDLVAGRPVIFVGDGAVLHAAVIRARLGPSAHVMAPPDLAPAVATIALRRARAGGGMAPHAVRPIYLRRPDAELARARRLAGSGPLTPPPSWRTG